MSSQLYLIVWPGGHIETLTLSSFSSAQKAHQGNANDAALYTVTEHTREEYLAALDTAVLMDKQAAIEAAKGR